MTIRLIERFFSLNLFEEQGDSLDSILDVTLFFVPAGGLERDISVNLTIDTSVDPLTSELMSAHVHQSDWPVPTLHYS